MITRETIFWVGDYELKMTVYDDTEWLVSINNDVLKVGATSNDCKPNWNKGLAEVFETVAEMIDFFEAYELINRLDEDDRIDSKFIDFLPDWRNCVTRIFNEMSDVWEETWIDGPQP